MGLPDMGPVHDLYLDKIRETMSEGLTPETIEKLMRAWTPMGDAGNNAWRQLNEQLSGTTTKA
jgi:hypothetical protein